MGGECPGEFGNQNRTSRNEDRNEGRAVRRGVHFWTPVGLQRTHFQWLVGRKCLRNFGGPYATILELLSLASPDLHLTELSEEIVGVFQAYS